jgi:hypothetical protein
MDSKNQPAERRVLRLPLPPCEECAGTNVHVATRVDPIPVLPLPGLPAYVERRETRPGVDWPEQLDSHFARQLSRCTRYLPVSE